MKVYVIWTGRYDHDIAAILATRALAEAWIEHAKRSMFEVHRDAVARDRERREPFETMGVRWSGPADHDVSYETFGKWYDLNEPHSIEEYELLEEPVLATG